MGASREVTVAALAEPTVALAVFALALSAGSTNLGRIVAAHRRRTRRARLSPGHLLAFAALFIVTLAETGRLPVDNPATHLELTMIHEAMVLEYSGRYLALIEWAAAIKLLVFFALLGNLFVPWGVAARADRRGRCSWPLGSFLLKLLILAVAVAVLRDAHRQAPPLPGARSSSASRSSWRSWRSRPLSCCGDAMDGRSPSCPSSARA